VKPEIHHFDSLTEFFISEGCHIVELSNSQQDDKISIARARVEPGVTTKWHFLEGTVERYVIIEGTGLAEIGDINPQNVVPGDCVVIPARCRQRITNTGKNDLIFLAICSPRFVPDNYREDC